MVKLWKNIAQQAEENGFTLQWHLDKTENE